MNWKSFKDRVVELFYYSVIIGGILLVLATSFFLDKVRFVL